MPGVSLMPRSSQRRCEPRCRSEIQSAPVRDSVSAGEGPGAGQRFSQYLWETVRRCTSATMGAAGPESGIRPWPGAGPQTKPEIGNVFSFISVSFAGMYCSGHVGR